MRISRGLGVFVSAAALFPAAEVVAAAELCIVPTAADNRSITIVCGTGAGYPNDAIGYRTDAPPCEAHPDSAWIPCTSLGAPYLWTISASDTDPYVNTGALPDPATLYLWVLCQPFPQGVEYAEFDLTGDLTVLNLVGRNGFTNTGTSTELRLSAPGCPSSVAVAAEITVTGTTAVESPSWGRTKSEYR